MSSAHSSSFSIATIDISLASGSRKRVESIKLGTRNEGPLKDIETTLRAGDTYQEKLMPLLVVTSDDLISVSARCSSRYRKRYDVVVDIDLRDIECMREEKGIKTYRKTIRNVEVVVANCPSVLPMPGPDLQMPGPSPQISDSVSRTSGPDLQTSDSVSETPGLDPQTFDSVSQMSGPDTRTSDSIPPVPGKLVPTTVELIRTCAKFRVLIIGNSGVGKSTLIRRMFGVNDVHPSETARGSAEIDREFISQTNERFAVHDSLGFEAGDEGKMRLVKDFVKRRQVMPRLEDQLHAIWLCVEIPYAGGRLAERGVEQFLKNQRDIIGNVPLIVVLTKVDLLDIRLDLETQDKEPLQSRRSRHLEDDCITPLRNATGRDITCVAVSAIQGYYILISKLMVVTQEKMATCAIHEAPRAMASIAQRVDIREKIEMSIAVGKQRYWNSLLKSAVFRGHTLRECLEVIRKDIVTVWNFIDLDHCLLDDKLIKTLIPTDLSQPIIRAPTKKMDEPNFLSAVAHEFADVVTEMLRIPYDLNTEAGKGVEIFMCYIVDLICVMQVIFVLAPDGPVIRHTVERAIDFCKDKMEQVHDSIKGFDKTRAIRSGGQDQALKEIETLISRYSLSEQEMAKLRQEVGVSSNE
ncbi:hypothetical protein JVU11DRAFT_10051 [Chiua virens]|nr:hypothetical protein JVU11DRAFT_10051 [Chiua virens]